MSFLSARLALQSVSGLEFSLQQQCLECIMNQTRVFSTKQKSSQDWKGYLNSSVLSSISDLSIALPRRFAPNYEKIFAAFLPKWAETAAKKPDESQSTRNVQGRPKNIPPASAQGYSFQEAIEEELKSTSDFRLKSPNSWPSTKLNTQGKKTKTFVTKNPFPFLEKTEVINETEKKRKAWVSKTAIDQRTRALVLNLRNATTNSSRLKRAEELVEHILLYPDARTLAVKERAYSNLLRLRSKCRSDQKLLEQIQETLSLLGYVDPVKGRGIRVLSIDGGGTRGVAALESLMELERRCNKKIHEMFDYVCGVSTGSLIAAMVVIFRLPLEECVEVYKQCSTEMFSQGRFAGTTKLFLSHAFYDASILEKMLKENMQDLTTYQTSRLQDVPKFAAVSCLMNAPVLTNYLFRNYGLPPNVQPHYPGSHKYKMWQAIRASSAAPGYYEEFKLDDTIHQDGGLLTNNPAAIAIHECKLLWPNDPFQCVISLGTGRYEGTSDDEAASYSTLKKKLFKVVQSATDTEAVHTVLSDLLPPHSYFRFNPYMSEDFLLDEIREDKTEQLVQDTKMYLRKNDHKLDRAVKQLSLTKKPHQKCQDWVKERVEMYH